jgi:tetratricopeptide (TPR) repeat protein
LQYDEALASFTEAHHRSEALYLEDGGNGDKLFNRAQAEFWVAFVHWRNGDLAEARRWLVKYRDSGIELAMLDETRVEWAREVAFGHHNLAVLNFEAGELDAAAAGFEQELEVLYAIQVLVPNEALTIDIADSVSWIGNIALARGDLDKALQYYMRSAGDLEAFSRESPGDMFSRSDPQQAPIRDIGPTRSSPSRAFCIGSSGTSKNRAISRAWPIARHQVNEHTLFVGAANQFAQHS